MNDRTEDRPRIALTMGDPAGIGPEVIVLGHHEIVEHAIPVVVGDAGVLDKAVSVCGADVTINSVRDAREAGGVPHTIDVLDVANVADHAWGIIEEAYGRASLAYVERAIELALDGSVDAIVTAPINKQSTALAGSTHAGHTGLLAARTGTDRYTMMLVEGPLRVTHVTGHVPLKQACAEITTVAVGDTIRLTDQALREFGIDSPSIATTGLNPHAGDGGLLGDEDAEIIAPAIDRAAADGIDVVGPEPPDTVYVRAASGAFDCVVSMYHDQGHIPIKMLGFSDNSRVSGVNITIGLPIIRTSVDHGTAFDIAGTGAASPHSLIQAVEAAATLANNREDGLDHSSGIETREGA